jgi:glycosyltransferase involved in cell wall biosynthesis
MPKVSVIIPTFNRAEFLRPAITSVLNQTFQDFEVIVVDDASKDDTREIVDRFHDSRIKYLYRETNGGEASARNAGILNSNGQYIAFLDDDDEWLPEKLSLQVDLLEHSTPRTGLVYTGYSVIDKISNKTLSQRIPIRKGEVYSYLMRENIIGAPSTVLLRRECIEQVGLFDENIAYGLDYDFWIRISKCFHFEFIEISLVRYYIHENRLSNEPEIILRGFQDMMNKYGKDIIFKNKGLRNKFLSAGVLFCYKGDTRNGLRCFLYAIKVNPLEARNYFNLGCSLLGAKNFKKMKNLKDKLLVPLRKK